MLGSQAIILGTYLTPLQQFLGALLSCVFVVVISNSLFSRVIPLALPVPECWISDPTVIALFTVCIQVASSVAMGSPVAANAVSKTSHLRTLSSALLPEL